MPPRRNTGRRVLLVAFLCSAVAIGLLMLKKYDDRSQSPTQQAEPKEDEPRSRVVALFFAAPDGAGLIRESRELESCDGQVGCIRAIITELVKGPLGELGPTLPAQTVVNGVSLANGIATVDLGEGIVTGLPGGSSSEMTAAYSIVNSIAANIPAVTGVKFLVDGREVDTLKGNLDLRQPLIPDFRLEKSHDESARGSASPKGPSKDGREGETKK